MNVWGLRVRVSVGNGKRARGILVVQKRGIRVNVSEVAYLRMLGGRGKNLQGGYRYTVTEDIANLDISDAGYRIRERKVRR